MRLTGTLLTTLALGACTGREAPPPAAALVDIASPAAPGSGEPNLTTGPDGRVYLSWIETRPDSAHALRWAALEDSVWSAPGTVAEGKPWFVNWADFPAMTVFPGGRMAAHWLQKSGAGTYSYDVRVARSEDGGRTWSQGTVPHGDGLPAEHGFVAMWPEPGDSVGLVWLDGREYVGKTEGAPGAQTQLRAGSVGPRGGAGAEVQLDARTCDCCQNAAALTSDGPLVVYRDRSPGEIRDIYAVRRVNGRWSQPAAVHADGWRVEFCPVNGPSVAAQGRRAAVAWFTAADSVQRVNVAFSNDAGATWSAPIRVDGGMPSGRVDVELVEGGAVVSWLEEVGAGAEIRVRRVGGDGRLGQPRTIATSSAARKSGFPRMALAGGDLIFAWTRPGEPAQVHTARMPLAGL